MIIIQFIVKLQDNYPVGSYPKDKNIPVVILVLKERFCVC